MSKYFDKGSSQPLASLKNLSFFKIKYIKYIEKKYNFRSKCSRKINPGL